MSDANRNRLFGLASLAWRTTLMRVLLTVAFVATASFLALLASSPAAHAAASINCAVDGSAVGCDNTNPHLPRT